MAATEPMYIGIDLGGTHLRGAVVRGTAVGTVQKRVVGTAREAERLLGMIAALIQELRGAAGGDICGVGLGVPALIDHTRGVVLTAPHYPAWKNVPLVEHLQQRTQLPIAIDNDAHCIALGEQSAGAAQALESWCMITLGTGIGGGIMHHRQVFRGPHGWAGEVGHLTIDARAASDDVRIGAPRCPCGGAGHWENFASASGMANLIALQDTQDHAALRERAWDDTGWNAATLAALADQGISPAQRLWACFGRYLGIGIASLVHVLGVTDFVIGGGLSGAWSHFIDATYESLRARLYPELVPLVQLHRAALGDYAGILGAAQLKEPRGKPRGQRAQRA